MSKLSKEVEKKEKIEKLKPVVNYMGDISYEMDPLETLKMVAASSIFAEPQYYRDGKYRESYLKSQPGYDRFEEFSILSYEDKETTSKYMERIIDAALDYDYEAVLNYAVELRKDYFMRLNPQVIMVRAALHPNRAAFNDAHPGLFKQIEEKVMSRADEPSTQLAYYLSINDGKKNNIPSILKRAWASKLASLSRYEVAKYKNAELGIIDTVRVSHAHSEILDELMKTGTLEVEESEKTWENLRSEGKNWKSIFSLTKVPHMAILRNLRGIATSLADCEEDKEFMADVLEMLKKGVSKGKQFPFRYYAAYSAIKKEKNLSYKVMIMEALEDCLQLSLENLPMLKGKTMVLTDNSGSAWCSLTTEYGTVKVAEIDNLSAVITAMRSEEGYVGVFGDNLNIIPVSKRNSILQTLEEVNRKGQDVGMSTENGIWLFLHSAIVEKQHWDNLFVYSDMQAGTGGLYGMSRTGTCKDFLKEYGVEALYGGTYVDLMNLLKIYRKEVNPKINVFSIQTAGYNNAIFPQYAYRCNLLYGWTGKEALFADEIIRQWNQIETKQKAD